MTIDQTLNYASILISALSVLSLIRGAYVFYIRGEIRSHISKIVEHEVKNNKLSLGKNDAGRYVGILNSVYWDFDKMVKYWWIWDINKMRN